MKHNISITMDQKLFRQLETIRGREKRSTFIEHLILLGLQDYANKKGKKGETLTPTYIADFKPKSA
ncbi:MAG: hypothetical protein ACQCN4_12705 [Candidatus Bathyarchaeia archaeon]